MNNVTLDSAYAQSIGAHIAQLAEELAGLEAIASERHLSQYEYRAAERGLQLLIEATIGIARRVLRAQGLALPLEARDAFAKLRLSGLDNTTVEWNKVVGMRNALVHDYLNLDPERIVDVLRNGKYRALLDFCDQFLPQ